MPRELFRFRYRNASTGKWIEARYAAERHVIAARHAEWEVTRLDRVLPDASESTHYGHFSPAPPGGWPAQSIDQNVQTDPELRHGEAALARMFLRRYVTWCVRTRRYAQTRDAAMLYRALASTRRQPMSIVGMAT